MTEISADDVEAVARALYSAAYSTHTWDSHRCEPIDKGIYRDYAKAAITAYQATLAYQQMAADAKYCKVESYERQRAQARADGAIKVLTGIYALLAPKDAEANGKRYTFDPSVNDPALALEMWKGLSERIREIMNDIAALAAQGEV